MSDRAGARQRMPVAVNYRGERVPVSLGIALAVTVAISALAFVIASWIDLGEVSPVRRDLLWVLAGLAVVFLAGLYDDYRPARTRGLVAQLAKLLHGEVTSGVVKLAAVAAASAFTVWMLGGRGWRLLVGLAVVAGAANLWNLLDVRPGRSIKFFLPVAVWLVFPADGAAETLLAVAAGAAAVILVLDLLERGMLGDSGSNVLGFVVGIGVYEALATRWLALVLVGILALHALAETVTLSRLIDAVPPLRWFDRVGRRKLATTR